MIKNSLKKLWKELFNDEKSYIEWYFNNIYNLKTTKFDVKKNYLRGMIFKNKYTLSIENKKTSAEYLVGVGVSPEYQNQGVMTSLLMDILKNRDDLQTEFLYLTPIDKTLYEKFGFTYISTLAYYKIDFININSCNISTKIQKIDDENYDKEILSKLVSFYLKNTKNFYLKVKRTIKDYKNILSELFCEDGILYISYNNFGEIIGTMLIIKNDDIFVKELLFQNKESLNSLLFILSTYKRYSKKITITQPENSYLEDYLNSDFNIIKTIKNKIQIRILDVTKSIERISARLEFYDEIVINILDEQIPKNTGIYKIKKDSFIKLPNNSDYDIKLNITDFTKLAYGFRDFLIYQKQTSITIKNNQKIDLLTRIFHKKINYFNQDF